MSFIKVEFAKNPVFSSEDKSAIDLIVKFEHLDTEVPFTASPNDPAIHGKDIYERAKAGEWGQVQPYNGPSAEVLEGQKIRNMRERLLIEIDGFVTNPLRWNELTKTQQNKVSKYRKDLLDITEQEGFPFDVKWPEKPNFM